MAFVNRNLYMEHKISLRISVVQSSFHYLTYRRICIVQETISKAKVLNLGSNFAQSIKMLVVSVVNFLDKPRGIERRRVTYVHGMLLTASSLHGVGLTASR